MRIFFAIGEREFEDIVIEKLYKNSNDIEIVDRVVHSDNLLEKINDKNPNLLIFRETIDGSDNPFKLILKIKFNFPSLRIIFIAGNRKPGDAYLNKLVQYQIMDIIIGSKLSSDKLIELINNPAKLQDVLHLLSDVDDLKEDFSNKDDEIEDIIMVEDEKKSKKKETEKEKTNDLSNKKSLLDDVFGGTKNIINQISKNKKEKTTKSNIEQEQKQEQEKETERKKELTDEEIIKKYKKEQTKESKTKNNKSDDKGFLSKLFNNESLPQKQRIVSFYGGLSGIGNTTMSVNVASSLAEKGYKTIILELDNKNPSIPYTFDFFSFHKGIEKALNGLEIERYSDIENNIVTNFLLQNKRTGFVENYNKFPENLDFMHFSESHINKEIQNDFNIGTVKELITYLFYKLSYDYIIIDVNRNTSKYLKNTLLSFSNMNFINISQDVNSIGKTLKYLIDLFVNREDNSYLNNKNMAKNKFIVNKYEKKATFKEKEILAWINEYVDDFNFDIFTVGNHAKDLYDSAFNAIPLYSSNKNKYFNSEIESIAERIIYKEVNK